MHDISSKSVLILEPFYTGSHQQWIEGLVSHSKHQIDVISLPGRHWKWRMHGAAITMAKKVNSIKKHIDAIIVSDMLDVSTFKALLKPEKAQIPIAIYFHENQLTYPWSPTDLDVDLQRDRHYAWINYTSALTSDKCWFNSAYHLHSFTQSLPDFLNAFPDDTHFETVEEIKEKSDVLYLGLDLKVLLNREKPKSDTPIFLWNHRWEYDKGPDGFFKLWRQLKGDGIPFKLIVCGEKNKKYPAIFDLAREEFRENILHWGYTESREAYFELLTMATHLPVTSNQDFFGGSVVEAIAAGCIPILPQKLAYPEHVPTKFWDLLLYSEDGLKEKVIEVVNLDHSKILSELRFHVQRYDWNQVIRAYDSAISKLPFKGV